MEHLTKVIEAALFAADRPLTIEDLRGLAPRTTAKQVRAALEELRALLAREEHAVDVLEIGGGHQLLTRPAYAELLERAKLVQRPRRLSRAALETLAIIAYRQPVSRLEVEDIRGVSSEGVVRMLLERDLIDIAGRGEGLGRPLLYETTPHFLEHLGLNSVEELPRADELAVLLRPRGPVTLGEGDDDDLGPGDGDVIRQPPDAVVGTEDDSSGASDGTWIDQESARTEAREVEEEGGGDRGPGLA